MSVSREAATGERQPESSRSSLPGGSNGPQQSTPDAGISDEKSNPPPIEKTISCVSCRKRKLKCDRVKPNCGTCTRLQHECDYPERKRNLGSKKRNMKELEARLAQVETQLVAESKGGATGQTSDVQSTPCEWNNFAMDINMDMGGDGLLDESFDIPLSTFDLQSAALPLPSGNLYSQELISLGLQEPLPPNEVIDELHEIYFDRFHPSLPLIHKYRYLASVNLPPHMQPPICLRYAIWAMAASVSEKYMQYEDILYERARKYVEAAEMKRHGETFVTIQHAQTWSLIATFEAKKTYFTRAWMSTGRTVRLCQMLGLQRVDREGQDAKQILPPAKDWIELEERRRTFWAAFYGDRWASSGTGWPMVIQEKEIQTNLPASEESFENGIISETIALGEAFTPVGASRITPFGGVVLSACLFGHNFEHLHKTGDDERPEDLANGEFWKRHRQMDNVLSNTFMFLPDNLRLPRGLRDMNVVFLHMNVHASTISLHQAAVLTAEKHNLSKNFIRQCRARSFMAAEEITNLMKLVSHFDVSNMNSWVGFCLYVAGGVFIQDQKSEEGHPQSIPNLEFLLAAMKAVGYRHSITKHFTAQLELDIEGAGITPSSKPSGTFGIPNTPINGLLPSRSGAPMTAAEIRSFAFGESDTYTESEGKLHADGLCPYIGGLANSNFGLVNNEAPHIYGTLPSRSLESLKIGHLRDGIFPQRASNSPLPPYGIFPRGSQDSSKVNHPPQGMNEHIHPSPPNRDPPPNAVLGGLSNQNPPNKRQERNVSSELASSNVPVSVDLRASADGSPFDVDSFLAGNTPSSESSGANAMQYPYWQSDQNGQSSQSKSPAVYLSMFEADSNSFIATADWTAEIPFNMELQDEAYGTAGDI